MNCAADCGNSRLPSIPQACRSREPTETSPCRSGEGRADKAINNLTGILELDPKFADAFCTRGLAYINKGEWDKVIADFTEAIRLNPKNATAYEIRAVAYEKKGATAKAEEDHKRAKELGYRSE